MIIQHTNSVKLSHTLAQLHMKVKASRKSLAHNINLLYTVKEKLIALITLFHLTRPCTQNNLYSARPDPHTIKQGTSDDLDASQD